MGISRSAFYKALGRVDKDEQREPDHDELQLVERIKALAKRFP